MRATKPQAARFANTRIGWFVVAVIWLFMGALIIWGRGGLLEFISARRQVAALQAEVKALEEANAATKAEIAALKAHPELYEKDARERLFMKKPGEVILYLPSDKNPPAAATPEQGGERTAAPSASNGAKP